MAPKWSYKNQTSSYWGKFQRNFDQGKGNLVSRVKAMQVRVSRVKMTRMWGEIQGKLDLVQVSGEFEFSEFELLRFYCIGISTMLSTSFCSNPFHEFGRTWFFFIVLCKNLNSLVLFMSRFWKVYRSH